MRLNYSNYLSRSEEALAKRKAVIVKPCLLLEPWKSLQLDLLAYKIDNNLPKTIDKRSITKLLDVSPNARQLGSKGRLVIFSGADLKRGAYCQAWPFLVSGPALLQPDWRSFGWLILFGYALLCFGLKGR